MILKFRQALYRKGIFRGFHYWGFTEDGFIGPETHTQPIEEAHKNSDPFTGLTDKDGTEIYNNDLVTAILSIKVRERREGHGRALRTYAVYEDREMVGRVEFGKLARGGFTDWTGWCWVTDYRVTYQTGFYRGIGYTRSERKANESVPTTPDQSQSLLAAARKGVVVGSTHQPPSFEAEAERRGTDT